jgi:hypothetical protein
MHQPMFPANGSLMRNGLEGPPKAFSDDTKILGYDPVIMPALIQAELPLVHTPASSNPSSNTNEAVQRERGIGHSKAS